MSQCEIVHPLSVCWAFGVRTIHERCKNNVSTINITIVNNKTKEKLVICTSCWVLIAPNIDKSLFTISHNVDLK